MNIKTSLALLALGISSALAVAKPTETNGPALAGGYSQAKLDSDVQAAATFAVQAEAKSSGKTLRLVEVVKAEKQVVAGLNYRLDLKVQDGDKVLGVQAVVWRKLDGSHALTSWNLP